MEIKDQATATEAALNLDKGSEPVAKPGEPTAPKAKSTSAKMFPEFVSEDGMIVNRPVKPYADQDKALPSAAATPAVTLTPAAPATPAPTAPSYLDLSKLPEGTMVRLKVDGVEMDVPARDALKNIQLERHLTLQSQKLAADRAALEAERASLRPAPVVPAPAAPPAKAPASAEGQRIAQLEADLASLRAVVAPVQFQEGLKRLDHQVKSTLGADDFMTYATKIQEFVDGELRKPEVASNPDALRALDSQAFWYQKYQELKLKDLMAPKAPPVVTPTVVPVVAPLVMPPGTTAVIDRNGTPVPIPVIEGSGGAPSRMTSDADWQTRYQVAFARAKETGSQADWQAVFALKREAQ